MKTIHRYLLTNETGNAMIPAGGKILSAGISTKGIALFAIVDPAADAELRTFKILKTGEEIAAEQIDAWAFVASITMPGAPALHIFEVPN